MKEIFKVMPKYSDAPLPPLDEEMLADLAKIPAVLEGEFWPQQPCQCLFGVRQFARAAYSGELFVSTQSPGSSTTGAPQRSFTSPRPHSHHFLPTRLKRCLDRLLTPSATNTYWASMRQ